MEIKTPNQLAGIPDHVVRVENGKYTFICGGGWILNILRHGEPWIQELDAPKAVSAMMAELDAARVVIAAAREIIKISPKVGGEDAYFKLYEAMKKHDGLVGDLEPPSEWTQP